jgi:hypothetical protein
MNRNDEPHLYKSATVLAESNSNLIFCNYGIDYIRAVSSVIFEKSNTIKMLLNHSYLLRQDILWRLVECTNRKGNVSIIFDCDQLLSCFKDALKSNGYTYALRFMDLSIIGNKVKDIEDIPKFFIVGDSNKLLMQTAVPEYAGCFNNEQNAKKLITYFEYLKTF